MVDKKQWDLTKQEIAELAFRFQQKVGRSILLAELQRQFGSEAKAESTWWESFRLKHKIPKEDQYKLIADHEIGKVWIRGEVEELENRFEPSQHDNPNF